MRFTHLILLALFTHVFAFPCERVSRTKRDVSGNYTTSISSIGTEEPKYDLEEITDNLSNKLVNNFYSSDVSDWVDNCGSTNSPVVWQVAVAGKAMTNTKNITNMELAIVALENYRNRTGGYSASTAKNGDIYTDDNAQIAWVYADAYKMTTKSDYLDELKNITDFLRQYRDDSRDGGIFWAVTGGYIASISNLEAAVAAMDLYEFNKEQKYLDFAKECVSWTLDNFIDPNDGFIYDGMYEDGSINQGKLTYTIGVMISACTQLHNSGDSDKDWKAIAVEFGVKLISGGTLNNQFFSDGHINDIIERSHLVFVGFADLLKNTTPEGDYETQAYKAFKQLMVRESRHLRNAYSSVFDSDSCPDNEYNGLLKFASLVQVFDEVSRVVSKI